MPKELITFLISMVPVMELRGAIPYGQLAGLDPIATFVLCCLGNMLPVPFILLFVRKILDWMKKIPRLSKIALWMERKGAKNTGKVMRNITFGLMLFVAIPLPGTGAWTGALVAALLNMRMKFALPSIFGGVLIAGAIVTAIAYGAITVLSFLL